MTNILPSNRKEDIKNRGKNHLVYDYNGNIVKLEMATVWFTQDGNYAEPRSYENVFSICTIN